MAFDPQVLNGWKYDPTGINAYAKENGSLSRVASSLIGGEQRDCYLWQALLKCKPTWRRGAQKIGDCFAPNTHVIGPDGVKMIQDVKVGDRVYAGNGEVTEVISTQTKQSFKPLLTIHTCGSIPITVTADHKLLVYRLDFVDHRNSGKCKRLSKSFYERVKKTRDANKAKTKWQSSRSNVAIDQFEGRKAVLVEAKDLRTSDYLLCPVNTKFDSNVPESFRELMSNRETRWMIGLFLGDGHASKGRIDFACTHDEPETIDRLVAALQSIGVEPVLKTHHKSKKCVVVYWSGSVMAKVFREAFYDANKQKVLPSWAICDDVVAGLWDADGHQSADGTIQYFDSTSPSLAHGVRLWAINAGHCPTMKESVRSSGSYANAKPIYRVRWQLNRTRQRLWRDDDYLAMPITKIDTQEGPHTVYDIGVKHELHTFYANGMTASNCVSFGMELAATTLMAIESIQGKMQWIEEAATEPIYGGSRVEIWGKRTDSWQDGSTGHGAAQWVKKYGLLLRLDYTDKTPGGKNSEYDLRKYSGDKAKQWGYYGCGGQQDNGRLDALAKVHPIKNVTQVQTIEECIAALTNAYPVTIASMAGFGDMRRDANGLCYWVGSWAHQMCTLGLRWRNGNPEFRIFQSWGDSCSGPDPGIADTLPKMVSAMGGDGNSLLSMPGSVHDSAEFRRRLILPDEYFPYCTQPEDGWNPVSACSWWVDEKTMARILSSGDCWTYSGVTGFEPRKLDILGAITKWTDDL